MWVHVLRMRRTQEPERNGEGKTEERGEIRGGDRSRWEDTMGVTEVRHQRVQLSKVQISFYYRDRAWHHSGWRASIHALRRPWESGKWYWCICTSVSWCLIFMSKQISSQLWPIASAAEPTYVCSLLFNWPPKDKVRSKRVQEATWNIEAWHPSGDRSKGHLPGYVSVTSKKEERTDTWSESHKSVRQTSYASEDDSRRREHGLAVGHGMRKITWIHRAPCAHPPEILR